MQCKLHDDVWFELPINVHSIYAIDPLFFTASTSITKYNIMHV
jgi:hypothetical protein